MYNATHKPMGNKRALAYQYSSRNPRDIILRKLWEKFFVVEETCNAFGVALCTSECVVWFWFCRDTNIIEDRIEVMGSPVAVSMNAISGLVESVPVSL
jgi:hypothetical protein